MSDIHGITSGDKPPPAGNTPAPIAGMAGIGQSHPSQSVSVKMGSSAGGLEPVGQSGHKACRSAASGANMGCQAIR